MASLSKQELQALVKQGISDHDIGSQYGNGITRQAVQQLRKKYGIPAVKNRHAHRNKLMNMDYKSGKTMKEMSDKNGISISHVYRIINTKGKK